MKKPNYVFDDELYHWGIKGQRWGDRRFQNEDGSWTPEGRERYGKGGDRIKIEKARSAYNTQKYKADLKSKAQKEKDIRSAKEERNRIKENSKTMLLARKKQSKFDRLNKKEEAKLDKQGRPKFGMGKTKNMSDEDLERAINRLKLQAEYNKQYVLATQPNSALVKADRFFEGPTGRFVADLAVKTLPDITKSIVTKALDEKYKNDDKITKELEIAKKKADIRSTLATARKTNAEAAEKESKATVNAQEKHREEVKARAEKIFGSKTAAPGSSSIPKTVAPSYSSIPKTVAPSYSIIPKTVAPGYSSIPKTVAPGYSIIPKTTAPGSSVIPKTVAPIKKKKKK